MKKKSLDHIALILSSLALIVAFLGYLNSEEALQYQKEQDLLIKSPGLLINKTNDQLIFDVDKTSARLQTVILRFPDSIKSTPLLSYGHETNLLIEDLIIPVKSYFKDRFKNLDSVESGCELKIPVAFDYEVVIDRKTKLYREDHFIVYSVFNQKGQPFNFKFEYTRFNFKLPIPLNPQSALKLPFSNSDPEKVRKQDLKELRYYLNSRFAQTLRSLNQETLK